MRILLVYPNIVESPKDISTGLGILSSILKQKGHTVFLLDTTFGVSDEEIIKKLEDSNPDIVGISTATNDFEYACHIASLIKEQKKVPIIAGGYHPTISPEEVIKKSFFDIICIGEGEQPMLELVSAIENNKPAFKIKNLWVKNKNKITKNRLRILTQDLDKLPFSDRDIFDYIKYLDWNHGTATFLSTRGCPYNCTYCINNFLIKKYKGKGRYVRFRSVDNIIAEIKQTIQKYGGKIKNIEFYDDTFTLDERRIKEFCAKYPKEINLPFNINARVNAVNPDILKLLKDAGCVRVSIGIESGDEYIRNKVLKRNMTDEQIINTFLEAKKAGLKTYAFNMVGIPFETKDSIRKTIALNRKCKPDYVGVSIFNVFKGTEIYEICKENNWLRESYAKSYFRESNIDHPNFSIKQLKHIRNNFGFFVFISYNPIRALIDLLDRNLSQINSYILIRSKILNKLKILRK